MTSPKTTNILLPLDMVLLERIDDACRMEGRTRAHWIRIAIWKELERLGIHLDPSHIHPAPRTGKGGTPSHRRKKLSDAAGINVGNNSFSVGHGSPVSISPPSPAKPKRKPRTKKA